MIKASSVDGGPWSDHKLEKFHLQRKLISLVRTQPALYDANHRRFKDDSFKHQLWLRICNRLSVDLPKCLTMWAELRYKYQRHVRRLQVFHQKPRQMRLQRPVLRHEENLHFLYTHVAQYPLLEDLEKSCENVIDLNDDQSSVSLQTDIRGPSNIEHQQRAPSIFIDLDEMQPYKWTEDYSRLTECVHAYPQLYDINHPNFLNYQHRNIIWGAISNELNDKATKLMKIWLTLITRYEWELHHIPGPTNIKTNLNFLKSHIVNMPGTVYKKSAYLRDGWHDPLEQFRTIVNMINVLKLNIDLLQITEDLCDQTTKPSSFHAQWQRVAAVINSTKESCEVTWLMLRSFYCELAAMRSVGYQLLDKWYFEIIIGKIFTALATRAKKQPAVKRLTSIGNHIATNGIGVTPLPLAIVYPPSQSQQQQQSQLPVAPAAAAVPSPPPPLPIAIQYPQQYSAVSTSTLSVSSEPRSQFRNSNIIPIRLRTPSMASASTSTVASTNPPSLTCYNATVRASKVPMAPNPTPTPTQSSSSSAMLTSELPTSITNPIAITTSTSTSSSTSTSTSSSPSPSPLISSKTIDSPSEKTICEQLVRVNNSGRNNGYDALETVNAVTPITSKITPKETITDTPTTTTTTSPHSLNVRLDWSARILNIRGPTIETTSQLSMSRTAQFIREVMSIPQLHSKHKNLKDKRVEYWLFISTKFLIPENVCRAIWLHLLANISLFPQIAPMSELILPTTQQQEQHPHLKVWEKSNRLFKKFDQIARKHKWMEHKEKLPALMTHFLQYEHLYQDMRCSLNRIESTTTTTIATNNEEQQIVWHKAREKYPDLNVRDIWAMFKFAFCTYMDDLERGIENPWPQNWWRALEKLKFLINVRYHPFDPYYYIIYNKFNEEVTRCLKYETLMNPCDVESCEIQIPWETEEAKRILSSHTKSLTVITNAITTATTTATVRTTATTTITTTASTAATTAAKPAATIAAKPAATIAASTTATTAAKPAATIAAKPAATTSATTAAKPAATTAAKPAATTAAKPAATTAAKPAATIAASTTATTAAKPAATIAAKPAATIAASTTATTAAKPAATIAASTTATTAAKPAATIAASTTASTTATIATTKTASTSGTATKTATATSTSKPTSSKMMTTKETPVIMVNIPTSCSGSSSCNYTTTFTSNITKDAAGNKKQLTEINSTLSLPSSSSSSSLAAAAAATSLAPPPLAQPLRILPHIDCYELTRAMRRFPHTYDQATTQEKRTAWLRVAKEMETTVTECRLSLQHAIKEYRILKHCDPGNRCRLNQRYYCHMAEISRQVLHLQSTSGINNANTPTANNPQMPPTTSYTPVKSLYEPVDSVYPERYIPEINLVTCKSSLVVKNWAYAVGNLTLMAQEDVRIKLNRIFANYAKRANINWPLVNGQQININGNSSSSNNNNCIDTVVEIKEDIDVSMDDIGAAQNKSDMEKSMQNNNDDDDDGVDDNERTSLPPSPKRFKLNSSVKRIADISDSYDS